MKPIILLLFLTASSPLAAQQPMQMQMPAPDVAVPYVDSGLGNIDHPVATKSVEAQRFFNQGLAYLYAFNHQEGINSFKQAAKLDPDMAMAYWGISLGLGSNYNAVADQPQLAEAYANLQKAIALAPRASGADRDYVSALSKRYSSDPKADQQKLAADYSAAMGELSKKYPDDLDAATLYAESMMNLHPWQLWSPDGKPNEGTLEIIAVLESVLKRNPNHIGANHYYIHAVEASPFPERGLASAYRLATLAPSAGHLVHMPSHIYLRTGDFTAGTKSNEAAIAADEKFMQRAGRDNLYALMYYNHNVHMLAASRIGQGNYAGAMKAALQLVTNVGPSVKAMPMLEAFMPYPMVVMIRFHRSDDILKYPQPPPEMKLTTAFWRLARGLALAETNKPADAEKELAAFKDVSGTVPFDSPIGNNLPQNVFKVAGLMLEGEIALANNDKTNGVETLRKAVAAYDLINYDEPPDFDIPVREWLARALMRSGNFADAESVYREELTKHPKSGRSLFGLAESLKRQGKDTSAELVRRQFESAWHDADTNLTLAEIYGTGRTIANK